ncbi:MAG: hypothetical protein GXW85_11855 [Clostridia bacterium]|nr:hypothetical protein [Clostridia bacterium]
MRRFFNGILVGSLLGGMISLLANGNLKPQRKKMMKKSRKLTKQASRVLEGVTQDVTRLMKKR